MHTKKGDIKDKAISVYVSCMLIIAIIGWNTSFSHAQEQNDQPFDFNKFSQTFGGSCSNCLEGGNLPNGLDIEKFPDDFKIENLGDNNFRISGEGLITGTTTLDHMKSAINDKYFDKENGYLIVGSGETERKINLQNLPSDVKNIKIDKSTNNVIYETKENGKVTITQHNVVLKNIDGKAVLEGYKVGSSDASIQVSISNGGEINVDKNKIEFIGEGTSIIHNDNIFTSEKDTQSSVEFVLDNEKEVGFILKKGQLTNEKYGIRIGNEGVYIGDVTKSPSSMSGRVLNLEGNKLTGDISSVSDANPIEFTNFGTEKISIDASLTNAQSTTEIPGDGEVYHLSNKGVEVSPDSGAITKPVIKDDEKPSGITKPTVGTPPTGGNPGGKNPGTTPGDCGPGGCNPGGGNPGGSNPQGGPGQDNSGGLGGLLSGSFGKFLPWMLLIGGGVLAAMLLFDDDKKDEEKRRNGNDNSNKRDDVSYNERSPTNDIGEDNTNEECICDENGCRNCPDGDCSTCYEGTYNKSS